MAKKDKDTKPKTKSTMKTNLGVKPRTSYKKKYEEALIRIKNLEINLIESKTENEININSFREKAKKFQSKAQKEVDKIKKTVEQNAQAKITHFQKYGSQKMLESILEVLLNLELAIQAGKKDSAVQTYVQGFTMLVNQLYETLAHYGVKRIRPQIGDGYNPQLHHAVETIKGSKNKVVSINRDGFMLHERVLKPAMVVIGK